MRTHTLRLEATLGLRDAADIHARLLKAVGEHDEVRIDTAGVQNVDITIIQLLVAANRSARKRGRSFMLADAPTGAFKDALISAGLLDSTGQCLAPSEAAWLGTRTVS